MLALEMSAIVSFSTAVVFMAAGVLYVRRRKLTVEGYLVSRATVGTPLATATLVASILGAWILFSPAETGTWAGIVALLGYAVGQAAPLWAFSFVGPRMRGLMPQGHSLTEYVWHRYGPAMYAFALAVVFFYMFIFLSAELTGIAKAFNLLADIPLGLTAVVVGLLTVAYTAYGGIRASIFTDAIQFSLILPLLLASFVAAVVALGGIGDIFDPVVENAPHLLSLTHRPGVEFGFTLVIAIFAANMFHQGFWQRVYACRDDTSMRYGFMAGGGIVVPMIFLVGFLGVVASGHGIVTDPSVALFSFALDTLPTWVGAVLLVLALMLVMSSLDTLLNGIASVATIDLARLRPDMDGEALLVSSRIVTSVLIVPAILIATRGYSVLYLFLIADLVCAAAVFPVFWGLYSRRFGGNAAIASCVVGLVMGGIFFPTPEAPYAIGWITDIEWASQLLVSFAVALGAATLASLILTMFSRTDYDFNILRDRVRLIDR